MSFMPPNGSIFFIDHEAWMVIKTDERYRHWWSFKNREIIILTNSYVETSRKGSYFLLPSGEIKTNGEIKNVNKNL